MYNHLNDIIVELKGLGKVIGKAELNCKPLQSLLKEWCSKLIVIEEAKDLATMTMKKLFGSFITNEHTLQMDNEEIRQTKRERISP